MDLILLIGVATSLLVLILTVWFFSKKNEKQVPGTLKLKFSSFDQNAQQIAYLQLPNNESPFASNREYHFVHKWPAINGIVPVMY